MSRRWPSVGRAFRAPKSPTVVVVRDNGVWTVTHVIDLDLGGGGEFASLHALLTAVNAVVTREHPDVLDLLYAIYPWPTTRDNPSVYEVRGVDSGVSAVSSSQDPPFVAGDVDQLIERMELALGTTPSAVLTWVPNSLA